jgi:hypothetical protein
MKPYKHSVISVKKFGGISSDYQNIHDWFDTSKSSIADVRHRMLLHNAFGIYLCEQVFGTMEQKPDGSWVRMPYIVNSDGKKVQVRDIGEQHVLDDLGHIPGLEKCFSTMPIEAWMGGLIKKKKVIRLSGTKMKDLDIDYEMSDNDEYDHD